MATTHRAAPRMDGSNCCIETLAIGATVCYAFVELGKFILNKAWYFTKESGYAFKDVSVATLHQVSQIKTGTHAALKELSTVISEVAFPSLVASGESIRGCCQVGMQSLYAAPAAIGESLHLPINWVGSGVAATHDATDANLHTWAQQLVATPATFDEAMRLPSEAARVLMNLFYDSAQNMLHGSSGIASLLSGALYEVKTTFWEMAGGSIEAFQEGVRSICMEASQLTPPLLGSVYEVRQTVQESVLGFVYAAMETLTFTGHQLQQFTEALPPEMREFFALPKTVLLEVVRALVDQFIASEMFIYTVGSASKGTYKELTQTLQETLGGVVQEMGQLAVNVGHEMDQALAGGAKACSEISVPLLEIGGGVIEATLGSLFSVSQGSVQATTGAILPLQEVGTEVERTSLITIHLVADLLLNSSQVCNNFMPALYKSIKEGGRIPLNVIEATVAQISQELESKGIAVRQGTPFVLNSLGEAVQIPREMVEEIVRILADHLLGAYNGARGLDKALREDLSDTFQILVADPFARYALPIIYFIGRRLRQAREASATRLAVVSTATARRWSELRISVSTRMEQISAAIARRTRPS